MHLANRPVYYTNGVETIAAHYTVQARDLEALGWTKVEKETIKPAEQANEVAGEAVTADADLHTLTKAELISYAQEIGIEIKPGSTKQEIIDAIEAAEND